MRVHGGGGGRPRLTPRRRPGSLLRGGSGAERCLAQRRELECRSHGTTHQLAERALGRSAGRQLGEHVFAKLGSRSDGTATANRTDPPRFGSVPRKIARSNCNASCKGPQAPGPARRSAPIGSGRPGGTTYDIASQGLHIRGPRRIRVAPHLSPRPRRSVRHERPTRCPGGARGHRLHARGGPCARTGPPPAPAPRRRRRRRPPARHRPPWRERLPARAHARVLQARDQVRRRLHRAGPRRDQGRRPRRPPRAVDRRHHRRRRASSPAARRRATSTARTSRTGSSPTSR